MSLTARVVAAFVSQTALEQIQAMSRREREALLSKAKRDVQGGEGLPFIRNID